MQPVAAQPLPGVRGSAVPVAASQAYASVPSPAAAWKEQYGYVGRDLKLMSVTSAVLFAVIVVAGLYLR